MLIERGSSTERAFRVRAVLKHASIRFIYSTWRLEVSIQFAHANLDVGNLLHQYGYFLVYMVT